MAIRSYAKAPIRLVNADSYEYVSISHKKSLTLWDVVFGLVKDFQELLVNSKFIGALIPMFFIAIGLSMIYQQFWPDVDGMIKRRIEYYDSSTVALASEVSVNRADYLSNPGAEYFQALQQQAERAHSFISDPVSNQYSGGFTLSIPSVGIENINVSANVNSAVESVYRSKLTNGLAHFAGTGLPISDVKSNIVIYGHSAGGNYYERTGDVAASFSVLDETSIGDEIILRMNGQEYRYRIKRSKIVQPNDVSILTGELGKETLTLFTCSPRGNNAQRFVVIADPITETV